MINILLIDTVIQKYDFNILENYPLNSLYSGILNLIENTKDIHYFVLNNNSYKSEYHYNNNTRKGKYNWTLLTRQQQQQQQQRSDIRDTAARLSSV